MAYQPIENPLPITGNIQTTANETQLDAFGRLRVSQLSTQLDLKHTQDAADIFTDKVTSGTGAINRIAADSMMQLTTAAASDYVISQTKQRFAYFSGKSSLMYMTFSSFQVEANIEKRIGYFSSSTSAPYTASRDGIYLESDGTDIAACIGKSGTIDKVLQSAWNLDKMDGTGISGINLDFSKGQILTIDFEWLGVGRVRIGFVVGGAVYYVHEFVHVNVDTAVYMKSSNQPLRWEMRQTGAGSGTFNYICATYATEGQTAEVGRVFSINNGSTHIDANVTGTKYMLLGLRLQAASLNTLVEIITTTMLAETQDNFLWEVFINPTVAGSPTWSNVGDSALQATAGVTANTVTNGTLIGSGYVAVSRQAGGAGSGLVSNSIRLGSQLDGTVDEIYLVVTPLSGNLDILGAITWREFN